MGAGIGNAVGMVKANPDYENKVIAVIGDSTFMHSGVTGIVDALYNKANITVMILDNRITAMTGHQDHPGTGYTLSKEPTVAVDYKNLALGVGYPESSIDTINPLNLSQTKEIIEKHLNMGKPSIIISKSPCALLNKKGKPVYFRIKDEYKKDCEEVLEIGCPAIEKQNGEVTINKNMCRACSMCVQIAGKEKIVSEKK
jgi:indolepyruvate ferredoxin oxidoreductase alpha subunit